MQRKTGESYLKSLADGRRVLLEGELVAHPVQHPAFAPCARATAAYYDHQAQDAQNYCDRSGFSWSYTIPASKEELRARGACYERWAEASLGSMGRSPDYMNSALSASASAKEIWFANEPARSGLWQAFYEKAAREDWSWSHACVNWGSQKDHSESALKVVKRTSQGLYVSGWRSVATAAATCNWLFCFQPALARLQAHQQEMALSFVVSLNAPGLTIVMRAPGYERPLNGFVDEGDCLICFQECFIPHEQVLIDGDVELYNAQGPRMAFEPLAGQQVLMRRLVRSRFLFGLAHLLAHSMGLDSHLNVSEKLGEFVVIIQTLESLALAAVEGSLWHRELQAQIPDRGAISSAMRLYPEFYERMRSHLLSLGASRWSAMPDKATWEYLENKNSPMPLQERGWQRALYQLAQQQTTSAWSARESLYERNFAGDLELMRASLYHQTDKSAVTKSLLRYLKGL